MRTSQGRARSRARTALAVMAATFVAAGCSSSPRFSGPSWNLTGGRDAAPLPPKPLDRSSATPADRPPITYRGGRDPITGRAPSLGGHPHGMEPGQMSGPPPEPQPAARPAEPTRPSAMPTTRAPSGRRTVEVLPGHSLAMIAHQHRLSIAALMQANNLRDPYVYPGQVLVLP